MTHGVRFGSRSGTVHLPRFGEHRASACLKRSGVSYNLGQRCRGLRAPRFTYRRDEICLKVEAVKVEAATGPARLGIRQVADAGTLRQAAGRSSRRRVGMARTSGGPPQPSEERESQGAKNDVRGVSLFCDWQ